MWEIKEYSSAGPLALGTSEQQFLEILGVEHDTFKRVFAVTETVYAFDNEAIHLTCDETRTVKVISVFRPRELIYMDVQLLGRATAEVIGDLSAARVDCEKQDAGYWLPKAGLLLVDIEGFVDGIELYE